MKKAKLLFFILFLVKGDKHGCRFDSRVATGVGHLVCDGVGAALTVRGRAFSTQLEGVVIQNDDVFREIAIA